MAGASSTKYSPEQPLRELWESIDFRDQFSQALNVEYPKTRIKHWRHLAEQFGIEKSIYESFKSYENNSPAEKMLEYWETTKPKMKVKDLKEACVKAKCQNIAKYFLVINWSGRVSEADCLKDLWDKDHDIIDKLILMLDEKKSWMDVAKALKIKREKYEAFESHSESNKARDLFDILTIEEAHRRLTVWDLKSKLNEIERCNIAHDLDEKEGISDKLLKDVRDVLFDIETSLNKPGCESVYKLAKLYKEKNGCLKDRDLDQLFREDERCPDPTKELMEYVLKRYPEGKEPTIRDLIVHLHQIKREELIDEYVKGDITAQIRRELDNLNLDPAILPRQPSIQSEDFEDLPPSIEETNGDEMEPGALC